jgi:hypothetical protein
MCGWAQAQPSVKQEAKDSACSNIVALSGNVSINCSSLTAAQRKLIESIPAVLNKILSNQLDPDAVMEKLDEILKAVNPNVPAKTYFCNGQWRTAGPGPSAAFQITLGGDDRAFQEMAQLNNSHEYAELLKFCRTQIDSAPEWLTPYLFCSLGHLALGNSLKAREMLSYYDSKTGPAYESPPCRQMSDYLHQRLQ